MPCVSFRPGVSRRRCSTLIFASLLGVVFLSACVSSSPAPDSPVPRWAYPSTRRADVVDEYHGVKVADPYRWLEDDNSPETKAWVDAENAVTFGYLRRIPEREAIRARLTKLWNYERYGVPFKQGGRYFISKNDGLQNQSVLYTMDSLLDTPRVLLDPNKLLQKFVGREVTLVRPRMASGTTQYDEVKATLLSLNGSPVWKIGNEIVTGGSYESIRFPELPENLYERPTLLWTLQNTGARRHRVEASYLTANLSWSADYVLNVAKDESSGDLDGWVTLVNHSGTAFKNASLQLVAGDLHRVVAQYGMDEMKAMSRVAKEANAPAPFQNSQGSV